MQLSPKNILDPEKFLSYEGFDNHLIVPAILNLIKKENLKICDVGGASGKLLKDIILKSKFKILPTIIDIDDFYKDKIINQEIEFINASILNNRIDDNIFYIVIFKHLLHHIVSNNLKNTIKIQKIALNEIFRITRKGGFVVFIEQVNNVNLFSSIIYLLSKFANRYNIKFKIFDTGKVVVHFLSSKTIRNLILDFKEKYNLKIYKQQFFPWKIALRWKITFLMSKTGSVFYILKVNK